MAAFAVEQVAALERIVSVGIGQAAAAFSIFTWFASWMVFGCGGEDA